MKRAGLLQSLPLIYLSLQEHQKADTFCKELQDQTQASQDGKGNFQVHRDLLYYFPKGARKHRWIVLVSLRPMLVKYFHVSVLAGHLGARKTFQKIVANFRWPKKGAEIF
jgi:hypothetical protein